MVREGRGDRARSSRGLRRAGVDLDEELAEVPAAEQTKEGRRVVLQLLTTSSRSFSRASRSQPAISKRGRWPAAAGRPRRASARLTRPPARARRRTSDGSPLADLGLDD